MCKMAKISAETFAENCTDESDEDDFQGYK